MLFTCTVSNITPLGRVRVDERKYTKCEYIYFWWTNLRKHESLIELARMDRNGEPCQDFPGFSGIRPTSNGCNSSTTGPFPMFWVSRVSSSS